MDKASLVKIVDAHRYLGENVAYTLLAQRLPSDAALEKVAALSELGNEVDHVVLFERFEQVHYVWTLFKEFHSFAL